MKYQCLFLSERIEIMHTWAPASAYAVATAKPIPRPPPAPTSVIETQKEIVIARFYQ